MSNIGISTNQSPGSQKMAPGLFSYRTAGKQKPRRGTLDKLEQLTQPSPDKAFQTFKKRARAKYTQYLWLRELAKLDSPLKKNYTFAQRCSTIIKQDGDKFTARYCGNRFCLICNRIRTGKLINAYQEPLDQLHDKQFVTITRPNVPAEVLRDEIKYLYRTWRAMMKRAAKQGLNMSGIRKLEVTYNPTRNDFHPHLHLVVDGTEKAEWIVNNWLFDNPEADREAQDIRPCTDYLELFKYVTKLTSKSGKRAKPQFYPQATDTIFNSIAGVRIFQPFGTIRQVKVSEDIKPDEALIIEGQQDQDTYTWSTNDWYSTTTGEALSNFTPTPELEQYREAIAPPTLPRLKNRSKPPD